MSKKGFTIIEVVVVFLLMLCVVFLVFPKSLNSTKQARLISKWSAKYSELQYMFSVIKAQSGDGNFAVENKDSKQKILLASIKPYLRITSRVNVPYKQYFMDNTEVPSNSKYYFDDFYYTSLNEIVGLKLMNPDCKGEDVCAIIFVDVNGIEAPNTWGYDIFGINVLLNEIEPLGKNVSLDILKANCSKYGSGLYCSYYYLIGGKFD